MNVTEGFMFESSISYQIAWFEDRVRSNLWSRQWRLYLLQTLYSKRWKCISYRSILGKWYFELVSSFLFIPSQLEWEKWMATIGACYLKFQYWQDLCSNKIKGFSSPKNVFEASRGAPYQSFESGKILCSTWKFLINHAIRSLY